VHAYRAYGLVVHSVFPLPELEPAAGPPDRPDVVIRRGPLPGPAAPDGPREGVLRATPREVYLFWHEVGAVLVRDGREILVAEDGGADAVALRAYLLGPALALLLHQRGLLVLHASAVAMRRGVVGFLAASGQGKSTIAAWLRRRGHPLVADDTLAVELHPDGPRAHAGFPQLRLWPDTLAALGQAPGALPRVRAADDKRGWRLAAAAVAVGAGGLHRLYAIEDADALAIEPLAGHTALYQLVRHAYISPVLGELGSPTHLAQCARLAGAVPVARLRRPRALAGLDALAALIEADTA